MPLKDLIEQLNALCLKKAPTTEKEKMQALGVCANILSIVGECKADISDDVLLACNKELRNTLLIGACALMLQTLDS